MSNITGTNSYLDGLNPAHLGCDVKGSVEVAGLGHMDKQDAPLFIDKDLNMQG